MKSLSRRSGVIASLLLAPVLTACGFSAQTDQVYQPAEGVLDRSGSVDILNALVVSGDDGAGTLATTLVNNLDTDAQLTNVTGPEVTVPAPAEDVEIPALGLNNLADGGEIAVFGDGVVPGTFVELTLTFSTGQATTIKAPVVTAEDDYAEVPLPDPGEEDAG